MIMTDVHLLAQWFRQPLDVPTTALALLWSLPICLSIALVYKAIKIRNFSAAVFSREAVLLFITIVIFLILVALVLLGIACLVQR